MDKFTSHRFTVASVSNQSRTTREATADALALLVTIAAVMLAVVGVAVAVAVLWGGV